MIKPQPYKITCKSCDWSKLFAPQSDVIMPGDRPKKCPKCGSEQLNYKQQNTVTSLLTRLMNCR